MKVKMGSRSQGHARSKWKGVLRYRSLCLSPVLASCSASPTLWWQQSQWSYIFPTPALVRGCCKGTARHRAKGGPEKLLRWNCRLSRRELEGTFSQAKETSRCSCTFSLALPLPLIPISAGARMGRGGKVMWLDSGWHGKDKSRRASKGSLWLVAVYVPDWCICLYMWVRISCLLLSTGKV